MVTVVVEVVAVIVCVCVYRHVYMCIQPHLLQTSAFHGSTMCLGVLKTTSLGRVLTRHTNCPNIAPNNLCGQRGIVSSIS